MIVLFISECEKAAWKRSRRILSRYGTQIGRRTWLARMSTEGLRDIRQALTKAASRHTAITCHRIKGRYQTELVWIVGSRRHFNYDGTFCFSYSTTPLPKEEQTPPAIRLLSHLCILAGLFHDFGKHGACFQAKLRDSKVNQSDPIRHERLSLLLLLRLIELLCPPVMIDTPILESESLSTPRRRRRNKVSPNSSLDHITDNQWLNTLADSKNVYEKLNQIWQEIPESDWQHLMPSKDSTLQPPWGSIREEEKQGLPPLLSVLCFLILSHHKLPDGHEESFSPLEQTYLNQPESILKGLVLATELNPAWQQSPKLVNDIIKHARRAHYLLEEHVLPLYDNALWYSAARYHARCALVLADHKISSTASKEYPIDSQSKQGQQCFANSYQGYLRQTLASHLERVGRLAGRGFNHLSQLQQNRNTKTIEYSPPSLKSPITVDAFKWQQEAERKLLKVENLDQSGFFGLIIAETGSGKTRGNARILAALHKHENYRFTVALGLRTLTLQTGDEYRHDLGFGSLNESEDQCAVMVGGALTIALHELEKEQENIDSNVTEQEQSGRESSELDDDFYEGLSGVFDYDPDSPWPEELNAPNNSKLNHLLQVPILICTVDHLMPFIQSQKASAALLGFRLAGSDLIIDEIDSFATEDLPALLKLAYVVGFNGRKLLLSSATLPPAIAHSFYQAYETGFHRWQQLQGINSMPIACGWFSHHSDHIKVNVVKDRKDFANCHQRFVAKLLEINSQQPVRRRLHPHLVPIIEKNTVYQNIMATCKELHQRWNQQDPKTGIYYSIGCVRWTSTKNTRRFAHYWLNHQFDLSEDIQLKVICYHAKHLPLIRHHIEQTLNKLLKRSNHQPHEDSSFANILRTCQQEGKKHLLVVVSTSPISEVGRDHDYDWSVVEPNSYWSLIQMAGRVWRHRRDLQASQGNIGMMSQTMRRLEYGEQALQFSLPGPESGKFALDPRQRNELSQVFALDELDRSIDSRFTIQAPDKIEENIEEEKHYYSNMSQLEHGQLKILLEDNQEKHKAMYFIESNNPSMVFTQKHSQLCPFRKDRNLNLLWFDPEEEGWKYLNQEGKKSFTKQEKRVKNINHQVKEINKYNYSHQSYFDDKVLNRYQLNEDWQTQLAQKGLDNKHYIINALSLSAGDNFQDGKYLEYSDLIGWQFVKE
ncbi:P-loop NTPase family protein [Candidatus Nitrosacidococcus tergens]|uniref:CRISPR-associated helicase Cas3 family n=1 Tax=Candidatus Nitrosacidococcus tergens TaxID=553981 RepID=A0A7G1Q9K5_9GAMM|nr:helicase [Candidatus Nitrosacidococcus tergens]CAB1275385.1 CRISPR-associated helicase Cas3 family [Candidatus Nitrosacidococcus tergens]